MELSQILNSLNSSSGSNEKVASYNNTKSSSLEEALDRALNEPLTKTASSRRQSNGSPVADLTKIAAKLASAEQEALIKEAELYGAAVCDGFMSRMKGYEASGVKVASFNGGSDYDSEMAKLAMELGYQETKAELEKVASAAYNQGYNSVMHSQQGFSKQAGVKLASVVKTASDKFASLGYKAGMRILASMRG